MLSKVIIFEYFIIATNLMPTVYLNIMFTYSTHV